MSDRPSTLGELRASGWVSRSVKDEVRENAIERIRAGEALFPGSSATSRPCCRNSRTRCWPATT